MTDQTVQTRGACLSKVRNETEKAGAKTEAALVARPAAGGSGASASQPHPPAAPITGQPNPSSSNSASSPQTPAAKQAAAPVTPRSSISSTLSKAAKITVPGGRNTPDGRVRRAILIGINYRNCTSAATLGGCANDVVAMHEFCTIAGHGDTKKIPQPAPAPIATSTSGQGTDQPERAMVKKPPKHSVVAFPQYPYETYLKVLVNPTGLIDYSHTEFQMDYIDRLSSVPGVQFFVMVDACKCETFIDLPYRYNPKKKAIEKLNHNSSTPELKQANEEYYDSIKAVIFYLSSTDAVTEAKETHDHHGLSRGSTTRIFTDHIVPLLEDNLFDGLELATLMDELNKRTPKDQTPYLSMSKDLPENVVINFKNND